MNIDNSSQFQANSQFQTNSQIPNKQTSTKNEELKDYLNEAKLAELKIGSSSGETFAIQILNEIFDIEELKTGNITGQGKTKLDFKKRLDPCKIRYIERICSFNFNVNNNKDFINKIRNAITRHVGKLSKDSNNVTL